MFVDSHCHIAGPEFAADLAEVVERARSSGLAHAMVILAADDEPEMEQAAAVTALWPEVRYSVGVHPHNAGKYAGDAEAAARLVDRVIESQPLTRAVGEIGLDYHYDFAPRPVQQSVFAAQIRLAKRRQLPIVIHTREADDDTFRILQEEAAAESGGVFHCFTGDRDAARRALDTGFHISLAGIVTFPRALELKEVARMVPLDRLLIETDSPFLAPSPLRGKRNEPANVVRVAEVVAELRGMAVEEVGAAAAANFRRLFAA
ncbi:MAG TPA: TatD family hydrolase [Vicinamibacterales bacterium]|nr:TatD family hydrolase [Vicinamibacterales bacterium]